MDKLFNPLGIQLAPLFVEIKIPLSEVPANIFSPQAIRELTLCPLKPVIIQFIPLLEDT